MEKKKELKPCPFCGGEASIEAGQSDPETREPYAFFIRCSGCQCYLEGPSKNIYDWESLRDLWDTRITDKSKNRGDEK